MRLRQEQVVFALALAVAGLLGWSLLRPVEPESRGSRASSGGLALDLHPAPDVARALPDSSRTPALARTLFAPPSDTRVLPPLDLVEPPREGLSVLFPPGDPAPAPRAFGRTLRTRLEPLDAPDLFAEEGELDAGEEAEDGAGDAGGPADDVPGELAGLGYLAAGDAQAGDPFEGETPAQREARYAGYRQRYDWVRRTSGELVFGRIVNAERFSLKIDAARASEPLSFVQVDPETGREIFRSVGAPAIPIERSAILEFAFAETAANQIDLGAAALAGPFTRGAYEAALALGERCLQARLEAPRALEIARDLFQRAAAFDAQDPLPRLGLVRTHEATFDFESAHAEASALLEAFGHRPEVHVRLAAIEERLLLFEEAEARLRRAAAQQRASWEANWALGAFLLRRERAEEGLEFLQQAQRFAPQSPELQAARVGIRTDLGAAELARGELEPARAAFASALSADARAERARAGARITALCAQRIARGAPAVSDGALAASSGGALATAEASQSSAGFELLLAEGLAHLEAARSVADLTRAKGLFDAAAAADPLRANRALDALSFLAERAGHPERALEYVEDALEIEPGDAWALYQRGRLLVRRDDAEGARASLLAALDRELDFEDALVALGDMAFRLGNFEDAERFLERAVTLESTRPEVHALRGLNLLRLGDVSRAARSFERALALRADDPVAKAGDAWCTYLAGDAGEARIRLANLDDSRRHLPNEDPWRAWARAQIERLNDHLDKVEWTDGFERKRLGNGWIQRGEHQPTLIEGALQIQGAFTDNGTDLLYREIPAGLFVSFQADVWIGRDTKARAGLVVANERARAGAGERIGEASVSRHKEGDLQVRLIAQGRPPRVIDLDSELHPHFPIEQWVRLSIEKVGLESDAPITIRMDGVPLVEEIALPALGRAGAPLVIGLFVEGEAGRPVLVRMDDVSIVYRKEGR
jgi:Flp pilus assembly protein TadD